MIGRILIWLGLALAVGIYYMLSAEKGAALLALLFFALMVWEMLRGQGRHSG